MSGAAQKGRVDIAKISIFFVVLVRWDEMQLYAKVAAARDTLEPHAAACRDHAATMDAVLGGRAGAPVVEQHRHVARVEALYHLEVRLHCHDHLVRSRELLILLPLMHAALKCGI